MSDDEAEPIFRCPKCMLHLRAFDVRTMRQWTEEERAEVLRRHQETGLCARGERRPRSPR